MFSYQRGHSHPCSPHILERHLTSACLWCFESIFGIPSKAFFKMAAVSESVPPCKHTEGCAAISSHLTEHLKLKRLPVFSCWLWGLDLICTIWKNVGTFIMSHWLNRDGSWRPFSTAANNRGPYSIASLALPLLYPSSLLCPYLAHPLFLSHPTLPNSIHSHPHPLSFPLYLLTPSCSLLSLSSFSVQPSSSCSRTVRWH